MILKLTDKEMGIYESFLDEMYQVYKDHTGVYDFKPFSVKKIDMGFEVEFTDDGLFEEFITEIDHDCKASPEDGCGYCSMLLDLGLIEDIEPEQEGK